MDCRTLVITTLESVDQDEARAALRRTLEQLARDAPVSAATEDAERCAIDLVKNLNLDPRPEAVALLGHLYRLDRRLAAAKARAGGNNRATSYGVKAWSELFDSIVNGHSDRVGAIIVLRESG